VAALVHAESPEEILFTSGGTEAANLAVKGVAYANRRRGTHLVCSEIEHPAVLNSIEFLEKEGFTCSRVKVDARGWVDPEAVAAALTEKTILICVHHVNHDIGTIEPIREIGRLAGERGIPLFVDAVASGGWLPIDVQTLGATLLSLAPHRFYGPKGAGVLYRSRRVRLTSVQHGGVQEGGRRAGTENVPAIVGAGVAAEVAGRQLSQRLAHTAKLQQGLWEGLSQIPYRQLNGPEPGPDRISTNLNISFEFIEGEGVALMADMQGLAVASGASCVSKALKVSPVLKAIGLDHALAQGNILLSLGQDNTEQEIDFAVRTLTSIVAKLRGMSPLWDEFQRGVIDSVIQRRPASARAAQRNVPSTQS
jgi:cysteine desulfurase